MSDDHKSVWGPLRSRLFSASWFLPLLGFVSLIWFLIRVVPKPSRAAYPCQRAAFPIASGFVLWLVGLSAAAVFVRRGIDRLRQARYLAALGVFAAAVGVLAASSLISTPTQKAYAQQAAFVPSEALNQPMGQPRGIHPGRVVWVHEPRATLWEGDGYWWEDDHTDPAAVNQMVSESMQTLTGQGTDAAAWEALFRHFNRNHGKGDIGYQAGEKIAVKLNLNQIQTDRRENYAMAGPQMVMAWLSQLVEKAGVPSSQIAFYDATRVTPTLLLEPLRAAYPDVRFVDWEGGGGSEKFERDADVQVHWSEELTLEEGGGNPTYLPSVVTEADYLINLANLRGHSLAGVTLGAKNHFGTIVADRMEGDELVPTPSPPIGAGIHPYVTVHDFHHGGHWEFDMRAMGTYNALVDLMGHRHLGEKTLLHIIDGLYAVRDQGQRLEEDLTWQMPPFNGHWTASLFVSQDGVAIESVGVDFLRSEPTMNQVYGNIDNYLHEAALAHDPPSGWVYDPEADGIPLTSLGVHEHWNNSIDKQYSGNLGVPGGIELVTPEMVTAITEDVAPTPEMAELVISNYPNPFNASTVISFGLPRGGRVILVIHNVLGQPIAALLDEEFAAGVHKIAWDGRTDDGRQATSGVYLASLEIASNRTARKILLAR